MRKLVERIKTMQRLSPEQSATNALTSLARGDKVFIRRGYLQISNGEPYCGQIVLYINDTPQLSVSVDGAFDMIVAHLRRKSAREKTINDINTKVQEIRQQIRDEYISDDSIFDATEGENDVH